MKKLLPVFCVFGLLLFYTPSQAQFLKKLKQKVQQTTNKVIDKKVDDAVDNAVGIDDNSSPGSGTSSSGKPTNKGGAGLKNTPPPDVKQQMTEAETAYQQNKYSDARYSIQQALIGVEIQLGRELLHSLPATVDGLPKDTTQDKVVSTQWGWSNMTIQRVYSGGKDKQITVNIGNSGLYAGLVNMYFNSAYVQADASQQNVKQVKVKGYKAIIQYDDSKGYTLIAQLGQSSMIAWECINFADENEVMNAAGQFDIDGIKKTLGEQ